jgi:hypothetical protein
MSGVTTDTPPASPTALSDARPPGQKADRMLSDEALMARHRDQPERGILAVAVRHAIRTRYPEDTFSAFAQQVHSKMKSTRDHDTRARIRKRLSDQFRDTAGPTIETINATLLLAVDDADRETVAQEWGDLYPRAYKKVVDDRLPDFVEVIRHPEHHLTEKHLANLAKKIQRRIPRSRNSADDTSHTPASTASEAASVPPTDPDATDDHEALLRERTKTADLQRYLDEWLPTLMSLRRYKTLCSRPEECLTDEKIDDALHELARGLNNQVELLEPAEDFARSAARWQESAIDQPVTVGLPPGLERGTIVALVIALLIVLGCLGYKVIEVI